MSRTQVNDVEDIASRTAAEIALAYRGGQADPVAVTECLLERTSRPEADSVFITVTRERALEEARNARARYRAGRPASLLDGVPIAWKDNIRVAGAPTTAASSLLRDASPETRDMECVANAAAAGMVCLGKVNLTEFAYSGLGLNPHFGTPRNPADPRTHRAPGGSSSGSGVSVAARLAPCAVGSDTGGSIRLPAAFNGVVGFKPSDGRVPKAGIIALASTLDTIGPLARSVADCALVESVLRGAPAPAARRLPLEGLEVVAPTNLVTQDAEPAVVANYEAVLAALGRAGVQVRREAVPALDEMLAATRTHGPMIAAEAFHEMQAYLTEEAIARIDRRVVHRIMQGKAMTAFDLLSVQRTRRRLIGELRAQLGAALLVMPTSAITAPKVAPLDRDDELFHRVNTLALRNTTLGNMLDLCGLALPNGRNDAGMPTSFLLSAPVGEDERLLGYGMSVEALISTVELGRDRMHGKEAAR